MGDSLRLDRPGARAGNDGPPATRTLDPATSPARGPTGATILLKIIGKLRRSPPLSLEIFSRFVVVLAERFDSLTELDRSLRACFVQAPLAQLLHPSGLYQISITFSKWVRSKLCSRLLHNSTLSVSPENLPLKFVQQLVAQRRRSQNSAVARVRSLDKSLLLAFFAIGGTPNQLRALIRGTVDSPLKVTDAS